MIAASAVFAGLAWLVLSMLSYNGARSRRGALTGHAYFNLLWASSAYFFDYFRLFASVPGVSFVPLTLLTLSSYARTYAYSYIYSHTYSCTYTYSCTFFFDIAATIDGSASKQLVVGVKPIARFASVLSNRLSRVS